MRTMWIIGVSTIGGSLTAIGGLSLLGPHDIVASSWVIVGLAMVAGAVLAAAFTGDAR